MTTVTEAIADGLAHRKSEKEGKTADAPPAAGAETATKEEE